MLFFGVGLVSVFLAVGARLCVAFLSVMSRSSVGGESVKRVVCGGGIGDSRRWNRRQLVEE